MDVILVLETETHVLSSSQIGSGIQAYILVRRALQGYCDLVGYLSQALSIMSKKGGPKQQKDEIKYEINEIVLGKLRGFPAWPGQVVDPETVRPDVARDRPKKANFYCIRFFPAGDHAWLNTKDLSKLKKHEIEAYINEPHKKNGDLLSGYRVALDPSKWEEEMAKRQEAAEEADADEEVDELEGEEDDDGNDDDKPKVKKRKRDADAAAKAKKKTDKPAKSKKNGPKSKTMIESEDEGERGDDAGPSNKAAQPPAKKLKREKSEKEDDNLDNDPEDVKVKDLRHRLQRAFLGKVPPKDEDMPALDALFIQVEQFKMSIKNLQHSKIGKVMRHIAALKEPIPRDEEFKFKDRAQTLVNKWQIIINSEKEKQATETPNAEADGAPAQPPAEPSVHDGNKVNGKEENGTSELTVNGNVAPNANVAPTGDIAMAENPVAETTLGDVTMSEAVTA
ncbi:Tudor PWWP MBT [Pyrrhoderma noxium]|uniref:Tudor PWWP MBT n=1 Tax=Pyrrhoderma noxium TaxID=2282107 RepID=A0A286UG67_9AGAM|nr:Tudor PWWP MBT [Pyrrhoderma noxium]